MAVTTTVYNAALTSLANKEIDWGTDTVRCMLVGSGYTFSQTSHQYKTSVSSEVSGTGYTTRGKALTNKTEAFTGQVKKFKADDVVWADSTITARGAVVYVDTGSDATSPLICYVDFGQDRSSNGADFSIVWHADGLFTMTVAVP